MPELGSSGAVRVEVGNGLFYSESCNLADEIDTQKPVSQMQLC